MDTGITARRLFLLCDKQTYLADQTRCHRVSNQGTEVAKVAVVGPTRMNYPRNFAAVLALAKLLSKEEEV